MNRVLFVYAVTWMLLTNWTVLASTAPDCPRAKIYLGNTPFLCAHRDTFSQEVHALGLHFKKTLGFKQIYKTDTLFSLPATAVALFNEKGELVMLQYIFPANDSKNSYKGIRQQLDKELGTHKRIVGYERSPQFEFRWRGRDGVNITFKRKKNSSHARLTYSIPHKAKAFLYQQGYRPAS